MAIDVRSATPLIEVFDMAASVRFYRDVLGFTVVETSDGGGDFYWARLTLGGAALMLNTAYEDDERPPAPEDARVRAHGDTTLFFDCPDVAAAYQHLRGKGVDVDPPAIAPYGMTQLWVTDPDGFRLCFQS